MAMAACHPDFSILDKIGHTWLIFGVIGFAREARRSA
jgi:hypothetical protein